MQTLTTDQRNILQAQLDGLADGNLNAKVSQLIHMLADGKVPADQIDNTRELLKMAKAEQSTRGSLR